MEIVVLGEKGLLVSFAALGENGHSSGGGDERDASKDVVTCLARPIRGLKALLRELDGLIHYNLVKGVHCIAIAVRVASLAIDCLPVVVIPLFSKARRAAR